MMDEERPKGFGPYYALIGLWRSISPRETVTHGRESEVAIPEAHTRGLARDVDIILAIVIFLIHWIVRWGQSGNMYYMLSHLWPWKTLLLHWLLFATWPGLLFAHIMSARRRYKELRNRYWEQFEAADHLADKIVGVQAPDVQDTEAALPVAILDEVSDATIENLLGQEEIT